MTMRSLAVTALVLTQVVRLDGQVIGCADTKFPAQLPPPSALVDSAHAIADLGAFAEPTKPMLFSVFFTTGDSVAQVRALDKKDGAATVSLVNYVRHAAPREFWAFRVRITGGDAPTLTLERSTYCPPVSRDGDVPFATRATITASVAVEGGPPPAPPAYRPGSGITVDPSSIVAVEALISVDGRVLVGRVVQSLGSPERDARIVQAMKRVKFEPAKLDGQPFQAVYRSRGESPRP
jgi:hypothetical protein